MQFTKYALSLSNQVYSLHLQKEIEEKKFGERVRSSIHACVILAQEEAGSGVCINNKGEILTCAHCVGEERSVGVIFATTGQLYLATFVRWDDDLDCALLKIDLTLPYYSPEKKSLIRMSASAIFPFVEFASNKVPPAGIDIVCVGQPSAHDMESKRVRKTGYPPVYLSPGKLCGYLTVKESNEISGATDNNNGETKIENNVGEEINYYDNYEIGCLKHDAWTYYGHSGAPLISLCGGKLVGMHSSWDDTTGLRHGIPLPAIHRFLQ